MPLLYLLTTDGSSREDGNVYYATHILVDAEKSQQLEVNSILRQIFPNADSYFTFTTNIDEALDEIFYEPRRIVAHLSNHGYKSQVISPVFITKIEG